MKFFGWTIERKDATLDQLLQRLEAVFATTAGVAVSPETCEDSPTVQAIVNSVSMRIATLPLRVQRKTLNRGRESREDLPNHPVSRLLRKPNGWQSPVEYWLDATSALVRYGRYVAIKNRGITGPIRWLTPVNPGAVDFDQDADTLAVSARVTTLGGRSRTYDLSELHVARGRSRDFLTGTSPVTMAREAIALEIAAQKFGAAFFGNGAMPGLIFSYLAGSKGHVSKEKRDEFVARVTQTFSRGGAFKALLLPPGVDKPEQLALENDKAQFLETRKLQRSIIAGAFGVPPHLVGDLERSTFSNIEQQSREFVEKVVLPYVRIFESAMERDLLTDDDRNGGVVIRFNLDGVLRADFAARQAGLKTQREMGVINADEWREIEGYNPIPPGQGGDAYWQQGPSGQNQGGDGAEPKPEGEDDDGTP